MTKGPNVHQLVNVNDIHAFFISNTFISNTRPKIVKFLATFKQNAEAQFSLISFFKKQYSALKMTVMSDQNK